MLDPETQQQTMMPEVFPYYAMLLSAGVNPQDISLEGQSANILENARYGAEILKKEGFEPSNIMVVSSTAMSVRRAKATLEKQMPAYFPQWGDRYASYSYMSKRYPSVGILRKLLLPELKAAGQLALGEIARLPRYAAQGDIQQVLIPENITRDSQEVLAEWGNAAMLNNVGGIDFSSERMNLEVKLASSNLENKGIKFHLDPDLLQQLRNASGFVPVIINIQPITNLRQFLGAF